MPGVPRHPGGQGADLQARLTPRPRGWWNASTTTWSGRSCPVGCSPHRRTSTPNCGDWLVRANHRQHRVLGCRPADRVEADKAAMLALPPVAPSTGWRSSTRLPRDHYVRAGRQRLLGAPVCGRAAHRGHRGPGPGPGVVRRHGWSPTTSGSGPNTRPISDPEHVAAAKVLRRNRFDVVGAASARRGRATPADRLRHPARASTGRWRDGRQDHRPPAAT